MSIFREVRLAQKLSLWERFVEWQRLWHCERWEYRGRDGRWYRFWRRDGKVPAEALSRPLTLTKPCTCASPLSGPGTPCRGAESLGIGWHCVETGARGRGGRAHLKPVPERDEPTEERLPTGGPL